jgi:hypothetical protein
MEQDDLLQRITAFRERHGIAATVFGKLAIGDGSLIPEMTDKGRKPRGLTLVKIAEFMRAYDEAQKEIDLSALWLIRRCGFITLANGEPCLEGDTQISREVFQRLLADGRIIPNGDAMFGAPSQTFRAKDQLNVAA